MAGIFGDFFLVSVSHKTKHENSSKNSVEIRGKIRFKNFGELSFCNSSDLSFFARESQPRQPSVAAVQAGVAGSSVQLLAPSATPTGFSDNLGHNDGSNLEACQDLSLEASM